MLMLTRKPGEGIVIGQDVELIVISLRGRRVRLAIRGPSRLPIRRPEALNRDRPERIAAAETDGKSLSAEVGP